MSRSAYLTAFAVGAQICHSWTPCRQSDQAKLAYIAAGARGQSLGQVRRSRPETGRASGPSPIATWACENTLVRRSATSGDRGRARSGEADVQDEVPDSQVEYPAAGPVHDGRQQDDGQDYHDHPEEEHDDAGNGVPRDSSRSSHDRQLPAAARLIRRRNPQAVDDFQNH